MADLAVWQRTIVDEEGNVIPGAEVEVRREEDDSLATLYADRAGETPLANPLAADMSGFVRFFAQGDAYTITAVGAGSTRTWRFDPTGRLQEFDRVSEALAIADGADTLETRRQLGEFATVADVQSRHIPAVLESIRTFGRDAPGDGPALNLVRGSEVPGAVQSADGQWWEDVGYNTITVRIPSQFPTLQAAFDHYSRLPMRQGAVIKLLIESGHALTKGLRLECGDYQHFVISSEDAVVPVAPDLETVSATEALSEATNAVFALVECISPLFDITVDASAITGIDPLFGLVAFRASSVRGTPGSGVRGTDHNGHIRNSEIFWRAGNWSDSRGLCLQITAGSRGDIASSVFNDAFTSGSPGNTQGALDISRGSIIYANGVEIKRSGQHGLSVRRSYVIAQDITVLDAAFSGVRSATGSVVFVGGGSVTGSGSEDLYLHSDGAVIYARNCTTTSGSPSAEDSNIPAFNVLTPRGYILDGQGLGHSQFSAPSDGSQYPVAIYDTRLGNVTEWVVPDGAGGLHPQAPGTKGVIHSPSGTGTFNAGFAVGRRPGLSDDDRAILLAPSVGSLFGSPTGGPQGPGSLNAEAVYVDGVPVVKSDQIVAPQYTLATYPVGYPVGQIILVTDTSDGRQLFYSTASGADAWRCLVNGKAISEYL